MRVLVTGGAGFIGSALVRYLVNEKHYDVLNVDKLTYAGNLTSLATVQHRANYQFLKADIADRKAMDEAFASFRPQRVMHLAAESHVDRSIDDPGEFLRTNVLGTAVLLETARHYHRLLSKTEQERFRVLHVSTDEVYGSLGAEGKFAEETRYDPSSPYSATKAASDHLAKAWSRTFGLPVIVSNCSNNYGPYHFPEKLIPLMILNAVSRHALPVYGNGSNVRDWLFVDDHVRALDLIISRGRLGETYNVGGQSERSNLDVVHAICRILGELKPHRRSYESLIAHVADRPGHDQRYAIDSRKLETELGWQARENFDSGLRKTIEWYLGNRWWWEPLHQRHDAARLGLTPVPAAMLK